MKMRKLRTLSKLRDGYRRLESNLRLRYRTAQSPNRIQKQRRFSETLVNVEHRSLRHIQEDINLFINRDENLKSHTIEEYFVLVIPISTMDEDRINL